MKNNQKLRHDNGGFSLVELIVVIAIMAVLASVAVIGVSVYVDKAGEAADKQLIMEIEDALVMGGYNSSEYAPGKVIGAVAIGATGADFAGSDEINQMMIDAFGENWKQELKLQSDSETLLNTDASKVWDDVKNAQQSGSDIYASVPNSSFYAKDNNSNQLTQDVDRVAAALGGVLNGMGASKVTTLWGEFSVPDDVNYQENPQLAANLTVFAAADSIIGADEQTLIDGWASNDPNKKGSYGENCNMVTPLVMNFAKCTALKNYYDNVYNGQDKDARKIIVGRAYENLMEAMEGLDGSGDGYVANFNAAIGAFESAVGTYWADWERDMAETDAKAFIASMSAVNSLENTYVSADKAGLLSGPNAFDKAGADDILNTMVNYANMGTLPDGDYIITLVIDENGVPTVSPALPRN